MFCLFELGSTPFMYCAENKYKTVVPVRVKKNKNRHICIQAMQTHTNTERISTAAASFGLHINTSFRNYDIEASK